MLLDERWRGMGLLWQRLDLLTLGAALLGFMSSYALRALRIYEEFRQQARGRYLTCLRIILIHNAMVNILPFRGGELAFPLLLQKHFALPMGRALSSLVWLRLQDAFVIMGLAVLIWPALPLAARGLGLLGVVGLALYLPYWARQPHHWHGGGALTQGLGKLRDAFADASAHARLGWLWTLANWLVKLFIQAWLLASLVSSGLLTGAAGALGAELAAILPIQGLAGFGTYEVGTATALLPSGIPMSTGLQAALTLHLCVIGSALAAGLLAWLFPLGKPSSHWPAALPPS